MMVRPAPSCSQDLLSQTPTTRGMASRIYPTPTPLLEPCYAGMAAFGPVLLSKPFYPIKPVTKHFFTDERCMTTITDDPQWPDFVKAFGSRAAGKFKAAQEWRRLNSIDTILSRPHPKFFAFRKAYPFSIHGRSKFDEVVTYENPGKMNLPQAVADGCTPAVLRSILRCFLPRRNTLFSFESNQHF